MSGMFRTSASDPLRIASVAVGEAGGQIGITLCPGKQGESVFGRPWRRDLAPDLKVIADWGACAVVTLLEEREMHDLGVTHLGEATAAAGMEWFHLPIRDQHAPDQRFEESWRLIGPRLVGSLYAGNRVLVHCRGGLGRAGTVAARLLIDSGHLPDDAISAVRRARPGAIETAGQEAWLVKLGSGSGVL